MSQSTIKNKSKGTTNMNSANTVADMNKLVEVDINEELEKNESENEDNNDVVDSEEDADDDELDDELELDDEVDDDELDEESDDDAEEVDDDVDDAEDDEREDDDEVEDDDEGEDDDGDSKKASKLNKKTKKSSKAKGKVNNISGIEMLKATKKTAPVILDDDDDNDDDDDDDMNELYLQKFDNELRENYIVENHAESKAHNYEEVKALSRVVRDGRGIIVDPLHKTNPILTKYEMTRVLGQRAKQLDSGAKAFVKVPLNVIDGYFIAMLELEQKKIPFIIKRPLPNGGVEYWNVSDLEVLI